MTRMNTQASHAVEGPSPPSRSRSARHRSPFIEKVRGVLRVERYAYATEKTYVHRSA